MDEGLLKNLRNERGQTTVEYILLLGFAFITAFIMVTGPLASYTEQFLDHIANGVKNVVQSAEWQRNPIQVGNPRHPSAPKRFKPLHL